MTQFYRWNYFFFPSTNKSFSTRKQKLLSNLFLNFKRFDESLHQSLLPSAADPPSCSSGKRRLWCAASECQGGSRPGGWNLGGSRGDPQLPAPPPGSASQFLPDQSLLENKTVRVEKVQTLTWWPIMRSGYLEKASWDKTAEPALWRTEGKTRCSKSRNCLLNLRLESTGKTSSSVLEEIAEEQFHSCSRAIKPAQLLIPGCFKCPPSMLPWVVHSPMFLSLQLDDKCLNVVVMRSKALCSGWSQVSWARQNKKRYEMSNW